MALKLESQTKKYPDVLKGHFNEPITYETIDAFLTREREKEERKKKQGANENTDHTKMPSQLKAVF